jgi:hypothetical protein
MKLRLLAVAAALAAAACGRTVAEAPAHHHPAQTYLVDHRPAKPPPVEV